MTQSDRFALTTVDNHSFVESLLTKGPILDAGCRGFRFANWFADRGHKVYALDPVDETDSFLRHPLVHYSDRALVARQGLRKPFYLVLTPDPEARYLAEDPAGIPVGISHMDTLPVSQWDLVKLNIEGAEFDILKEWPGPIARQIVVSFHEHCAHAKRGDDAIWSVVQHLSQWYGVVRHVKDERYCAGANWWDSVFCLKELMT